jgi:predicted DNA-binding WGR domain protein
MRRFELVEGTSSKFWEIAREGAVVTVRWGRIGTEGQTKAKDHGSIAKAESEHDELVREKTKKGYRETSAAASAPDPVAAPPSAGPIGDDEGSVTLEPDELGVVIPWRGRPGVSAWTEPLAGKLLAQIKLVLPNVVRAVDDPPGTPSPAAAARRASVASFGSLEALDVETGANLVAAFSWAKAGLETLMKLFAAAKGLPFALEALVLGIDRGPRIDRDAWPRRALDGIVPLTEHAPDAVTVEWVRDDFLRRAKPALVALRALAASAPDDAYRALVAKGHALFDANMATVAGGAAIAFVASDDDALAAKAARLPIAPKAGSSYAFATRLLLAALPERDVALALVKARPLDVDAGDELLWTMVARLGPAAGSVLAATTESTHEGAVAYLRRIHTPASFRALLRFVASKAEGKAVLKLFAARPAITAAAIAPVLSAPKHPERAAAEVVASLLGGPEVKPSAPRAAAVATAVPAVLANPPWERARPEPRPLALDPILVPIAHVVTEAELQAWSDYEKWGVAAAEYQKQVKLTREEWARVVEEGHPRNSIELSIMHCAPIDVARAAWEEKGPPRYYPNHYYGMSILSAILRRGVELVPGLLTLVRRDPAGVDRMPIDAIGRVLQAFDGTAIADVWIEVVLTGKRVRAAAEAWTRRHPMTMALAAIPKALAPSAHPGAVALLRSLASSQPGILEQAVGRYAGASGKDVAGALATVVGASPLEWLPPKLPKLPEFVVPSALPPIALRSGGTLSDEAVLALATMLAFSTPDAPYAGLGQVKEACPRESLREWAFALYDRWMTVGAPPKEMWILHALGHLGDDEIVRRLGPKIRAWPGERAVARAQEATSMLALLGTDLALMLLSDLAESAKFDSLKTAAKAKIDVIAEARGLGIDELADRLVPDLGLDARGELALDFGARTFRVGFDEHLEPIVLSQDGTRLGALPKPTKSDDAAKAKEAAARLRALKKDVSAIAKSRLARLEAAMLGQTRFSAADFTAFFVQRPIVLHLTRRLLWKTGDLLFRVDESGGFVDVTDRPIALGAEVWVPHPLALAKDALTAWSQVFADYELLQPFPQLAREVFPVPPGTGETLVFEEVSLPAPKLVFGLERLGWQRGEASDGGAFGEHGKSFRGTSVSVVLTYAGAVGMGYIEEKEMLELEAAAFRRDGKAVPVRDVDPVFVSEVLRDVALLRAE